MIDYRRIGQAFKLGVVFSRGRRLVNDERWITYHPNGEENPGRKALIDENGNILKGGGPFGGMNLKDIPKKAAEIKEQRAKARAEKAGGAAGAGTTREAVGGKVWTDMSHRIDAERSRASEETRKLFRLKRQMNAASSPEEKAKLTKEHADQQQALRKLRADIATLEKEFDEKFPQQKEPPAYVNGYGEAMDPNKTQSRTTTTWERSQKRRREQFDRYWDANHPKERKTQAPAVAEAEKSAAQRIAGSRNPQGEIDSIRREKAGKILGKAVPGFSPSKTYGNTRESLASLRNQLASAALGGKEPTAEQKESIDFVFRKFGLDDDSAEYGVKGNQVQAAAQDLVEKLKTPEEQRAEIDAMHTAQTRSLERQGVFNNLPGWYDKNHNNSPEDGWILEGGTHTSGGATILRPERVVEAAGVKVEKNGRWRNRFGKLVSPERVEAAKRILERGISYNHRDDSFSGGRVMLSRIVDGETSIDLVRKMNKDKTVYFE